MDFYNAGVIQGLVPNFSLDLVIFSNGACLSRIFFMQSKKFWNDSLIFLFKLWEYFDLRLYDLFTHKGVCRHLC